MEENRQIKVSLILTSYNCKENLIRTLKGIDAQDYNNIEIIIVDGKSKDGTLQIIKNYATYGKYPCKWISEKDKGIYDALNKGYFMSSGDIIAICNDLLLLQNAVSLMVSAIIDNNMDGAHADLIYATENEIKRVWRMREGCIQEGWMPGHPTLYLKREIYEKYGVYNINYKCSADYEFMVRILKDKKVHLAYVPKTIIRMYYGGTSTANAKSYWLSIKEAHNALVENKVKYAFFIDCIRTLRVIMQFVQARTYNKKEKRKL